VPARMVLCRHTISTIIESPGQMNRIKSVLVMSALLLGGAGSSVVASDTIPEPSGINVFEMMPLICPLMGTSNPAALSLGNFSNINLAGAGYLFSKDEIKLVQQPEKILNWDVVTKGYMRLGKLALFGSFSYSNSGYHGVMYNGTFMFNTPNPFILGDTVPAKQFKEQFDMQGKISYNLTDRIIFGVDAVYQSAVGARGKDPRHKNTISALRITPGVLYDMGKTRLGLSGSFYTTSNEIDYNIEGNYKKDLFFFKGLGYFRPEYETSYYSQWYTGLGYSGAVQVDHSNGIISTLAEVSFERFTEESHYGSSLRFVDGIAWTNKIGLKTLLRIEGDRGDHFISLKSDYNNTYTDQLTYSQTTVWTESGVAYYLWEIATRKENTYMVSDLSATLSYSYLTFDLTGSPDIDAGVDVTMQAYNAGYYPIEINGTYEFINAGASLHAKKLIKIHSLLIIPGFEVGYILNLMSDISYTPSTYCVPEMAYHDYYVSKADVISAGASVRLELPFSQNNFVKSLFFIPKGSWASAPGTEAGDLSGYMIRATAGITF
jgi:hypothetical protein